MLLMSTRTSFNPLFSKGFLDIALTQITKQPDCYRSNAVVSILFI